MEAAYHPTIATATLSPARAGEFYRVALTAFGGTEPYRWTAVGLPEWLALDSGTGILSGSPANDDADEIELWVTVHDSSEPVGTDVRGFRLLVEALPPAAPLEIIEPASIPRANHLIPARYFLAMVAALVTAIAVLIVLDDKGEDGFNPSSRQTSTGSSQTTSPLPTPLPSLAYGDSVSEQLDANEEHRWSFEAEAGQTVTILAIQEGSASLRPSITLLDPDGNQIADVCASTSPVGRVPGAL